MKKNISRKKWIVLLMVLFILSIGFIGLINYIVDPYGLNSSKNKFGSNLSLVDKVQLTNLKTNLNADFYLIGTSRVKRINPNLVETYLHNKKVYNINIPGATLKENSLLVSKIISKNKNFIYGFDAFSLNKSIFNDKEVYNRSKAYKKELDKALLSSYYYYFSMDYSLTTFKHIVYKTLRKDFNTYYDKENKETHLISINGVKKVLGLLSNKNVTPYTDYETVRNEDIISLAKKASEKDLFIIYPKHFYYYILFQKYKNIENEYFNAIKTLVNNTNAKVWSFYGINDISLNYENFDKNGWHFKPKISKLIFGKIYNNKNINIPANFGTLITKENIDEYLKNQSSQIKSYDLENYK